MKSNPSETAALSALTSLGLSRPSLRKLYQHYGSFLRAWHGSGEVIEDGAQMEKLSTRTSEHLDQMQLRCEQEGIRTLCLFDETYPILLKEISSPPLYLFAKGNVAALTARHPYAVVGTRLMTTYGQRILQEIIPALVQAGVTIVSGLAYGIDAMAHEIALEHGGVCVGVLGSGVDLVHPVRNRGLAERILKSGGAIVSEHPLGTEPRAEFFPARNRIISGLSKATMVIEAKEKSGSLITAQFALDQNRDVYAAPGDIFLPNQQGTNALIAAGAYPITSAEKLLEQLDLQPEETPSLFQLSFDSDEERVLYEQLVEPRSIDEMTQETSLESAQIAQLLSLMELKGMVKSFGGVRFVRV